MSEAVQTEQERVPRKHRVVIAAAVAAIFGKKAVIRQVGESAETAMWTRRGRSAVQGSHNFSGLNRATRDHSEGRE